MRCGGRIDGSSSGRGRGWEKANLYGFPKGPLLGPLVVASLTLRDTLVSRLIELGVRDSKLLTRKARSSLVPKIINLAEGHLLAEIEPQEIDSVVLRGRPLMRLNLLEARYAAKILNELKPQTAYVDAPDRSPERFACQILQRLEVPLRLISEHHADERYPIVSAASVLAKVRRDEIVGELHKVYGDFGSGYPSDPKTIKFVKQRILNNRCDLPIVRRTWSTFQNLERKLLRF